MPLRVGRRLARGGIELLRNPVQHLGDLHVITGPERCARFLQSASAFSENAAAVLQLARGDACGVRRFQSRLELLDPCGGVGNPRLGGHTRARFAVDRLPSGVLGTLPGVERIAERLTEVALIDRVVRFLQRRRGGRVLVRRVLVGAGRACGVDRALSLIDFCLWRFGAACRKQQQECDHRQATHCAGSITGMVYDEVGCAARSTA